MISSEGDGDGQWRALTRGEVAISPFSDGATRKEARACTQKARLPPGQRSVAISPFIVLDSTPRFTRKPPQNIMNTTLPTDHTARMDRAALALDGLSVGDALGETCFNQRHWHSIQTDRESTAPMPWPWTDDTAMAIGIFEVLGEHGRINQNALAKRFAARYRAQPFRGYGAGAHRLLAQVAGGSDWRIAAKQIFPGGSFGNGSAMRIAPLAGYFAEDDYATIAEQARLSAAVTHAHPEGLAGAVAAAVAGAYAWKHRMSRSDEQTKRGLFAVVLAHTPAGEVRSGIEDAAGLPFDLSVEAVVKRLGNGSVISCQDTVPFCLWSAAARLDDYPAAIIQTIRACGDIDTTSAIVGGIVALAVGREGIPTDWLAGREELVAGENG
jgi:ADP-ribosylglycohydrolase